MLLRQGSADEPGAVGDIVLGSDGERSELIRCGPRDHAECWRTGPVPRRRSTSTWPDATVFRHAVERMSASAAAAAQSAGWQLDEVDRFYAHQANARITSALAHDLGIPADRVAENIREVGNTAGASIPILLAQTAADGFLTAGHRVLMAAFGGGLTWGAATLTWPEVEVVAEQ